MMDLEDVSPKLSLYFFNDTLFFSIFWYWLISKEALNLLFEVAYYVALNDSKKALKQVKNCFY